MTPINCTSFSHYKIEHHLLNTILKLQPSLHTLGNQRIIVLQVFTKTYLTSLWRFRTYTDIGDLLCRDIFLPRCLFLCWKKGNFKLGIHGTEGLVREDKWPERDQTRSISPISIDWLLHSDYYYKDASRSIYSILRTRPPPASRREDIF